MVDSHGLGSAGNSIYQMTYDWVRISLTETSLTHSHRKWCVSHLHEWQMTFRRSTGRTLCWFALGLQTRSHIKDSIGFVCSLCIKSSKVHEPAVNRLSWVIWIKECFGCFHWFWLLVVHDEAKLELFNMFPHHFCSLMHQIMQLVKQMCTITFHQRLVSHIRGCLILHYIYWTSWWWRADWGNLICLISLICA